MVAQIKQVVVNPEEAVEEELELHIHPLCRLFLMQRIQSLVVVAEAAETAQQILQEAPGHLHHFLDNL